MDRILWLDLETTGLDPCDGFILEVGAAVTDRHLHLERCFHSLVQPPKPIDSLPLFMNEEVTKMHTENGLLENLKTGEPEPLHYVAERLAQFITEAGAIGLALGGSCPSFDRSWLQRHMPFTAKLIGHRHVDVHFIRALTDTELPVKHRALNDTIDCIRYARTFKEEWEEVQHNNWLEKYY